MAVATTEQVHDRSLDLTKVERDFRTMKTGLLKMRPVFLRKATRTRGPALVSLLALKLARELDRRIAPLGLTVEDALGRLEGVKLVSVGTAEQKLWRLADSYPAAQQEVLSKLPKLPAPMLSLGKANKNRLVNPRQGRVGQRFTPAEFTPENRFAMGERKSDGRRRFAGRAGPQVPAAQRRSTGTTSATPTRARQVRTCNSFPKAPKFTFRLTSQQSGYILDKDPCEAREAAHQWLAGIR